MRILVAPDKFRGTLTARQAAEAIETGWLRARPADAVELAPMADGGEGTLDALVSALHGRARPVQVTGPLGDPVAAEFGVVATSDGTLGVVEMARASGLELLARPRRDPTRATTFGTGELMLAAVEAGADRILVCLGGSATNDGGAGMAVALGARLLDAQGREIRPGGANLLDLVRINLSGMDPRLAQVGFVGATDVDNPLTGPSGASVVYGPQKGASPDEVILLDRALGHLGAVVYRDLGIDLRDQPGAGAAGGLGFGLMAFCGARLRPGVEVVMEALKLRERMEGSDLVITGEGALDRQSLHGKVPAGVMATAELLSVPVAILCGRADLSPPGVTVRSLVERVGRQEALADPRRSLELVAQELAQGWGEGPVARMMEAPHTTHPEDR
jgi:glycerate kinase